MKSDAQKFTELTGGCWHKISPFDSPLSIILSIVDGGKLEQNEYECRMCGTKYIHNPTYTNAADILNKMKEFCGEEKYSEFIIELDLDGSGILESFINKFVLNHSALLQKVIEFLEEGK